MLENTLLVMAHLSSLAAFYFIWKKQSLTAYRMTMLGLWFVLVDSVYFDASWMTMIFAILLTQNLWLVDLKGKNLRS